MNNDLELLLAETDLLKSQFGLQSHCLGPALMQSLDAEYTYQSLRLEGSSLSSAETTLVVKNGLMSPSRPMVESLAALNHYQAVQFIREQAADQTLLSEALIKQIHGILMRAIDRSHAGVYRAQAASIAGSLHEPPSAEQLPELMAETVQWLRLEGPFMHPLLFAAETHQRLLRLQPFNSANGPCARLAMNLILLQEGFPIANIHGDPDSRQAYCQALFAAKGRENDPVWPIFVARQVNADIKALLGRFAGEQGDIGNG